VSLLWMGLISNLEGRSFWTFPNVMAGLFYGAASFRPDFHARTWSGLALHLLLTVAVGVLASQTIPVRARLGASLGLGVLLATGWFYLLEGFFWRFAFAPFALYSKRPAIFFGYVLIGLCVGLYSMFVRSERAR
jgi:hypothetical protein